MIDGLYSALEHYPPQQQTAPQKTLRMVQNDRTAGSMPVWETKSKIESTLSNATNTSQNDAPENALAYKAPDANIQTTQPEEFGFGDLVDMINPLHHLPVVGQIYRGLTGDEIKPIGQIIGGAIFGGPLGAATSLINVVIEEETGKDMTENAIALVFNGKGPEFRSHEDVLNQSPETRLAALDSNPKYMEATSKSDIPGNLLAFVDMKARPEIVIERYAAAEGRTAGEFTQRSSYSAELSAHPVSIREPITQVRFNSYRTND